MCLTLSDKRENPVLPHLPMTRSVNRETRPSLLLRLRDLNDHLAWSEFVERYAPEIYRWCRENRLQKSDAQDVTQDILEKLVSVMRGFDYDPGRGSFRGWLKTVTKNAIRDLKRKWEHRIKGSGSSEVNLFLNRLVDSRTLDRLENTIDLQHEKQILAEAEKRVRTRVSPATWKAFQMTAVQRVPASQVAETLNMPISQVYVAKSRVLRHLRETVVELQQEPEQ